MIPQIRPMYSKSHIVDMKIVFDSALPSKFNGMVGLFSPLQKYIDRECIRTITPYMPLLTGTMIRSMTFHTIIGSGEIRAVTPYVRRMYFENPGPDKPRETGALRGRLWWERWKNDQWPQRIVNAAALKFGMRTN